MNVDITLLIQVINFFIAYWFLHTYVFVPCAKILEKEALQDEDMQKKIEEALQSRNNATTNSKHRMLQIKQKLQELVPQKLQESSLGLDNGKHEFLHEDIVLSKQESEGIKKIISDKISGIKL